MALLALIAVGCNDKPTKSEDTDKHVLEIDPIDDDGDGFTFGEDCNDLDARMFPGNPENCDGLDNDCDGQIDEGFDQDSDGYLDASACEDGYDCDDANSYIHPNAGELCDGLDNDCDGQIDVDEAMTVTFHRDLDGDGWGDSNDAIVGWSCDEPPGYVLDETDCDDSNATIYPSADELCGDGVDQDCDGVDVICLGTLTCVLDGSNPNADIMLGASNAVEVLTVACTASGESFLIQELSVANCVTIAEDVDGDCADVGETAGNDAIASAVSITYVDLSDSMVTSVQFLSGGVATWNGIEAYVADGESATLEFMIDTSMVDGTSVLSGDQLQLNLDAVTGAFEAVGMTSGAVIDAETYVVGSPMTVRVTRPTITRAAGLVGGAAIPGRHEVLRFDVMADSHGDVELMLISAGSNTSDIDGTQWDWCGSGALAYGVESNWDLYNVSDLSDPLANATLYTASGDPCDTVDGLLGFIELDASIVVPAGSVETFAIYADSADASATSDDTLRVDLVDVLWADGFATDIGGEFIDNLPVTGPTWVY